MLQKLDAARSCHEPGLLTGAAHAPQIPGRFSMDSGWISTWVKMVSQWVCALLYTWCLVAPLVLRNREFL